MRGFSRCWSEVLPVVEKELGLRGPRVREPAPGLDQPWETPVSPAVLRGASRGKGGEGMQRVILRTRTLPWSSSRHTLPVPRRLLGLN